MKPQYEYSQEGKLIARLGGQHVEADPLVVISGLTEDNERLRQRVAELEADNERLRRENAELAAFWRGWPEERESLSQRVAELEAQVTTPTEGEGES